MPVFKDKKIPIFSRPKRKELWALLIEKAYAKIFGSYVACEKGFMDEAYEHLLPCPSARFIVNELTLDENWDKLA